MKFSKKMLVQFVLGALLLSSPVVLCQPAFADNTSYVHHAYLDLLGREPTTTDLNYWVNYLQTVGNRATLPTILISSDEHKLYVIKSYIIKFLGRQPYQGEPAVWLAWWHGNESIADEQWFTANLLALLC